MKVRSNLVRSTSLDSVTLGTSSFEETSTLSNITCKEMSVSKTNGRKLAQRATKLTGSGRHHSKWYRGV